MPPKRPVAYEAALPYPSSCLMAVILYFRLHYCKSLCKYRKMLISAMDTYRHSSCFSSFNII